MYKINQSNRNAVAIVAAFLITLCIVAYMATEAVLTLKTAFATRSANNRAFEEIYTK